MDYKQLIIDFNNGTIDPQKYQVIMDNDGGYWRCIDKTISESKQLELAEIMGQKYDAPNGYKDIVDVLVAAGVNADWC